MSISDNIKRILAELPEHVTLVAAIKYPVEAGKLDQVTELVNAGVTELGVNTYQQLEQVKTQLAPDILSKANFHFIGHLQSNKVKKVLELGVSLIQSVDSYKLANKINNTIQANEKLLPQDVLIQVKTDPSKSYGVDPAELEQFVRAVHEMKYITVKGLMTIPPIPEPGKPEDSRKYFSRMAGLFEDCNSWLKDPLDYLSMGMTDDYQVALEEGANMIRLGRVLFR
jgi:hypothetical protein